MKKIYVVWLHYPNEPKRYSVAFSNREAAEDYANSEENEPGFARVTEETLYDSPSEV